MDSKLKAMPLPSMAAGKDRPWRLPLWKRAMDIVGASILILMLSPIYIVVALLVRFESKGPIFYASKRAGFGYKVFDFYKFRSMYMNADQMLDKLKVENNQYRENEEEEDESHLETATAKEEEAYELILDDGTIQENHFLIEEEKDAKKAFVKIKNDPRITKVGHFIRNTSIDELPQLFNVLKGDMSLVGNRPLPLYEAEKLTDDDWILRFYAPAGITGLWQVTERGSSDVSDESRKNLDIHYALNYNFWMDLKILIKTPLAALQRENV